MIFWLIALAIVGVSLYFGRIYCIGGTCTLTQRIDGKTVFITGANTGIGRDTAIELSKKGAKMIIACRDQKKAQVVAQEIQDLGLPRPLVISLDLTDLKSVDKCVEELTTQKIDHVDILINNAGIMATVKRDLTKQGIESQFGVNHIGHFHLTNKLIPFLQKANHARVINVSALAHVHGAVNYDDINYDSVASSSLWSTLYTVKAYAGSKLMNIFHAQELNRRYSLKGDQGFKAISLHPGVIRTDLLRQQLQNPIFRIMYQIFLPVRYFVLKSSLQGAQTTIYCALEDYEKLQGGAYYSDCVVKQTTCTSQEAEKAWNFSEKLITQYHEK